MDRPYVPFSTRAYAIILFSLSFLWIGTLVVWSLYGEPPLGAWVLLVPLTALFIAGGVKFWSLSRRGPPDAHDMERMRRARVLAAARTHAGVLSPAVLAADTGWTQEQAGEALRLSARDGFSETTVDAHGGLVYRFPEMLPSTTGTPTERRPPVTSSSERRPPTEPLH